MLFQPLRKREPPKSLDQILGQQSTYLEAQKSLSIDEIAKKAAESIPNASVEGISFPRDSVGVYAANMKAPGAAKTGDISIIKR